MRNYPDSIAGIPAGPDGLRRKGRAQIVRATAFRRGARVEGARDHTVNLDRRWRRSGDRSHRNLLVRRFFFFLLRDKWEFF